MSSKDNEDLYGLLASTSNNEKKNSFKTTGLVICGLIGGSGIALTIIAAPFVLPALRKVCLPYVPATTEQVSNVLQALKGKKASSLIDLGSGDGRLVISSAIAAQNLTKCVGVELNPWLVLWSRYSAWRQGVGRRTHFYSQDLWKTDLKQHNVVLIFGVEEMMADLEKKFQAELSHDSHVIACRFPLPSCVPDRIIGTGIDTVWYYSAARLAQHSSSEASDIKDEIELKDGKELRS